MMEIAAESPGRRDWDKMLWFVRVRTQCLILPKLWITRSFNLDFSIKWELLRKDVATSCPMLLNRNKVCPKAGFGRSPGHKNPFFRANFLESGF